MQDIPIPSKKKVKASTTATTRSKDQSFITHSNNSTLNLDVYTPFIRNTSQQKGIVTSTPADGMVGVEPPVHMGAPTPILPQGIATSTRSHGGSGGTAAIKKTSREKPKTQAGVSKKTVVKATGTFILVFKNCFFLGTQSSILASQNLSCYYFISRCIEFTLQQTVIKLIVNCLFLW